MLEDRRTRTGGLSGDGGVPSDSLANAFHALDDLETDGRTQQELVEELLRTELTTREITVGETARAEVNGDFPVFPKRTVRLVIATPSELGVKGNRTIRPILDFAQQPFGLQSCSLDVPLHLLLDQEGHPLPLNFSCVVPVLDSSGDPHMFRVGRSYDGRRWLGSAAADTPWGPNTPILFTPRNR